MPLKRQTSYKQRCEVQALAKYVKLAFCWYLGSNLHSPTYCQVTFFPLARPLLLPADQRQHFIYLSLQYVVYCHCWAVWNYPFWGSHHVSRGSSGLSLMYRSHIAHIKPWQQSNVILGSVSRFKIGSGLEWIRLKNVTWQYVGEWWLLPR